MPTPNTPSESRKKETVKTAEEILSKHTGREGIYLTHGEIRGSDALEAMEEYAKIKIALLSTGETVFRKRTGLPVEQDSYNCITKWNPNHIKSFFFNGKRFEIEDGNEVIYYLEEIPLQQSSEPIKTAEEILKKNWNITQETKFHNYAFLFRSIIKAMHEYANQFKQSSGVVVPTQREIHEHITEEITGSIVESQRSMDYFNGANWVISEVKRLNKK